MRRLPVIAALLACAAGSAWGADPISPSLPPITLSSITVQLNAFVTIPADPSIPQFDPASGLTQPLTRILYATPSPDSSGRIFVNDIGGVLYETNQAGAAPTAYLDLRSQGIGFISGPDTGSPGFNGFAFHPNFNGDPSKPGYGVFYTSSWTVNDGTPVTFAGNDAGADVAVIREWTTSDPTAATFTGTSREVMRLGGFTSGHSNGMIAFNPTAQPGDADYGNLYIGNGDGAYNDPAGASQDLSQPLGKMLRINPLATSGGAPYSVPSDNPFLGVSGALPEIWASGFRSPQSFTWDSGGTHQMFINDIGQALYEEANIGIAGANYGWTLREGPYAKAVAYGGDPNDEQAYALPPGDSGFTYPVCGYGHNEGYALGSGILYRGNAIPALDGMYVMTDIVNGRLFYCDPSAAPTDGQATTYELAVEFNGAPIDIRDAFGYYSWLASPRVDQRLSVDTNGELLVLMKSTGDIFSLSQAEVPEPPTPLLLAGAAAMLLALRRNPA